MPETEYDLIVLGGGSAGLSLASVAARLGVKVALVDAGTLGGDCLHFGCVPSKTFIRAAGVAHLARRSPEFGIRVGEVTTDFPQVMARVRQVIDTIQRHSDNPERFRGLGCDVWTETRATFVDAHTVDVGERRITGRTIAICVGTGPASLDLPGLDASVFLTNETVFSLTQQPRRLLVIGAGPVACELAQAFQRLGTQVTLVNRSAHILSKEDPDVQTLMEGVFRSEGMRLELGVDMLGVRREGDAKVLTVRDAHGERDIAADEILVAVGRRSNAASLRPEHAGVALDARGFVRTDSRLRTSARHIYAAGDVAGRSAFTHSAGAEAGVIVSNALLHLPRRSDPDAVPWTTFTDPEVASTGLNESRARERGVAHTIHTYPFANQDRALAEGEAVGFVKVLLGRRGQILGCQIVGPHAGELIHEWIVARAAGMSISRLASTMHVYPTLALVSQQAAGDIVGARFLTPRLRRWLRALFGYRNTAIDAPPPHPTPT